MRHLPGRRWRAGCQVPARFRQDLARLQDSLGRPGQIPLAPESHVASGGSLSTSSVGSIPPMTHEIDLDELLAFARCPTEHLWRYQAKVIPPLNDEGLVQDIARAGLLQFYTGVTRSR